MTPESTSCPFCNALMPVPLVPSQRLSCPRCGESFPYRSELNVDSAAPAVFEEQHEAAVTTPQPWKPSNRQVALVIVAVMLTMGGLGLAFALETQSVRRANDAGLVKDPIVVPLLIKIASSLWILGLVYLVLDIWWRSRAGGDREKTAADRRFRWALGIVAAVATVGVMLNLVSGPLKRRNSDQPAVPRIAASRTLAPDSLEALRYLPADTNVVAAIHIAQIRENAASKEFLNQLHFGPMNFSPGAIEQWTGLKWESLDHLVLGLKVDDRLIPRLTLVACTRERIITETLRKTLKGTALSDSADRFHFKANHLDLVLWSRPSEGVVIVTMSAADLKSVPQKPEVGIGHFSDTLQTVIGKRIGRSAEVWVVAHSDDWSHTLLGPQLLALSQEKRDVLEKVRTLALWLNFEQETTAFAVARCADAQTANALEKLMETWGQKSIPNLKIVSKDEWVTTQAKTSAAALRQALEQ